MIMLIKVLGPGYVVWDKLYQVELVDGSGQVCAVIDKTLYVRRKP